MLNSSLQFAAPGFSPLSSGVLLPTRPEGVDLTLKKPKSADPEPSCVLVSREIEVSFVIRRKDVKQFLNLAQHPSYSVSQRYFYNKDLPDVVGVLHQNGILDFSWENRPFDITQGRRRRTTFPTEFHRSITLKGSDDQDLGKPQIEIVQTTLMGKLLRPFADRGAVAKERTLYQENGRAEVKFTDSSGTIHSAYIAIDDFTRAGKGKDFSKLSKSPFVKIEVEFDTPEARYAFLSRGHRFDWLMERGIESNSGLDALKQFKNRFLAKHGPTEDRKAALRTLKRKVLPKESAKAA